MMAPGRLRTSAEPLDVVVLKSPEFHSRKRTNGGPSGSQLPYRMDLLASHGIRLHWSDAPYRKPWTTSVLSNAVRALERAGAPFLQTLALTRSVAKSPVVLAMFESEGHFLAALRWIRLPPFTRARLVVMSCWLAELLPTLSSRRLAWYRRAYRTVDRVICLSSGEVAVVEEWLDLPSGRVCYVSFGVDDEFFAPSDVPEEGYVIAVGRDRGRDWRTLLAAARHSELPFKVLCRPRDIAGLALPSNVEVMGYVDRETYRDLTARARLAVVATRPVAYASGQSVLLESMALGKACVATATNALADAISGSHAVLTVPPGDPEALARAIGRAAADGELRQELGRAARAMVEHRFRAEAMWENIAALLRDVAR